MTTTTDIASAPLPARQRPRITRLRVICALALVPVLLGEPRWGEMPLAALHATGVLLVFAAVLGRFWAILYIGGRKNAEVMQDGPYSICRHPLYLFSSLGVIGFGLLLGSLEIAAGLGLAVFLVLRHIAECEERFLCYKFGPAYEDYRARVPRMLPDLRLFRTTPAITVSVGTLRRNSADALVFLAAIPLAEAINLIHQAGYLTRFGLY